MIFTGAPAALAWQGEPASAPEPDTIAVSVSGSLRPRYETLSNPLEDGIRGTEDLFSVRSSVEVELSAGDFDAVFEGLDSRRIAGDDNPRGGPVSQLSAAEVLQAHVAWTPGNLVLPGDRLRLAAGRMTLDFGGRRFAARAGFSSVPAVYDGFEVRWTGASGLSLRGFSLQPLAREPDDGASILENEVSLDRMLDNVRYSGVWTRTPLADGLSAEIGWYHLDEEDGGEDETRNRRLETWSARLVKARDAAALDLDIEGAVQTGEVRGSSDPADLTDLSREAMMLHAEAGYTLPSDLARVSLHYDFATGDENPADAEDNRFDPLFGDRSFEFGPTSFYGAVARANFESATVRLELTPPGPWDGLLSLRTVRLESETDSLGGSGLRDPAGESGAHAGDQIEWRVRRWLVKDTARLSFGGAVYLRGDFLERVSGGPEGDPLYTYADITWTF